MAPASQVVSQLPLLNKILKWYQNRETYKIESLIFKLHNLVTTFIIMVGFIVVTVENYIDAKSILCHTSRDFSAYAKAYCWIHGTAYVKKHLQGQATGCFVDQSKIETEEDAPITAYYLWLPYLTSLLFILAKLPHSIWKSMFENDLIKSIMEGSGNRGRQGQGGQGKRGNQNMSMMVNMSAMNFGEDMETTPIHNGRTPKNNHGGGENHHLTAVARNFVHYQRKYHWYQIKFAFWESMNLVCVLISMTVTHWLFNYQFFNYGIRVAEYISSEKTHESSGFRHNPMCELFPTEVACNINFGAATGGIDKSNFLCILGNNIFNQKYFFALWWWWVLLIVVSLCGMVYRLARICVPSFSKYILMRKIHGDQLQNVELTSGQSFVLHRLVVNLETNDRDQVLNEIDNIVEANPEIMDPKIPLRTRNMILHQHVAPFPRKDSGKEVYPNRSLKKALLQSQTNVHTGNGYIPTPQMQQPPSTEPSCPSDV